MTSDSQDGMILPNNGPWGGKGPGKGDKNGPGGGNPWGRGDDTGDIDALLRQAQNRFRKKFDGGGSIPPEVDSTKSIFLLLGILLAVWIATGFYRVQPGENAVLLTFGKWTDTRTVPGLGYHIPYPVQDIISVNVAFDRRIEVGFRDKSGGRGTLAGDVKSGVSAESIMLTGDENIIDIDFVVLWRINDARKYLFRIRDPETTIKKVAESAMREVIGRTEIQKAMTESRGDIEVKTKELMQNILDEYESGTVINSVQLLSVDPPTQVVDAFDDVQRARADRERLKNEAETYANDIVPRARGDAQKILQDAGAYKEAVLSKAEGDAARFRSIYKAYAESKDVTEQRIYIETMQEVMQNSRKIISSGTDGGGASPLLPYLPLEPLSPAKAKGGAR